MTVPFWCLLVVALIPYVLAALGGYFRVAQLGSFDNYEPRRQYARLEGSGARAWAAQQNAWESLGLFTAAVVVAHLAGADPGHSAIAAIVFLITRLVHPILYVTNLATLRSVVVVIGVASCIYLFILAATATAGG